MRAFVTGGTGLLGNNIVKELLGRGMEVAALVRRQDARRLIGPGVELIAGDLRDVQQFEKQMSGADVLMHAAACYGEFYRGAAPGVLDETNVAGTIGLLEAAERHGIRNVVFISSAAVLHAAVCGIMDEHSPYNDDTADRYFASKIAAEKAVLRFSDAHPDMRIVLILPTVMLGPGDVGPTPTGAFIQKLLRGELTFVLPGWHRLVDARDVAFAAAEAIGKGRRGERYVIGGRRYSVAEIYRTVTEVSGRPTPTKSISAGKLLFLSRVMSLVSRLTRRPPPLDPVMVKRLLEGFSFCSDKAVRELGISFRPLAATMGDTVKWFQSEHGADFRGHHITTAPSTAVRGTAWAVAAFYLLIAFEFFYMATPFAAYFYGAYLPGLEALNGIPALAWLTGFFLPHYAATSSALVNSAAVVGGVVTTVGVLGFLIGAAQVYTRKLRKRGAAVGGVYRFVRHPQYASLILAGMGMLLLWPRFLMVAFFVTMLFAYRALTWIEERECLRKFGQEYADYQQRTPRFVPFRLPFQMSFLGQWSTRPWSVRILAGVVGYAAALTLALVVQAYSLRHLYTYQADDTVYVSLTPVDVATLRKVAQVAASDERVHARIDAATGEGERLITYVVPLEWEVPEIPMHNVNDHYAPGDYDRRRRKLIFTRAVLRNAARVQGLDILRYAARTEPLVEVWIDEEGRIARVLEPPGRIFYGNVPVPAF